MVNLGHAFHTEQDPTHNEILLNDKKNLDYEDFEIDL